MQRAPDKDGFRMPFRDSAESTGAILWIPGTPQSGRTPKWRPVSRGAVRT